MNKTDIIHALMGFPFWSEEGRGKQIVLPDIFLFTCYEKKMQLIRASWEAIVVTQVKDDGGLV